MDPSLLPELLKSLSKGQLNELLKRSTGKGRDLARTSRGELFDAVTALPTEVVINAAGSLGLISGIWSGVAQSQLPQAHPAPVEQAQIPDITIIARKSLNELFGVRGKYAAAMVDVWNDPAAPTLDSGYKFNPAHLFSAISSINRGRNIWLAGPAGTGKTEFVKNLCAGLGRAFVRVSFDSGAERYEFIGGERVRNGTTVYQQGIVLRGMTRPGAIVLLDEVSFARPEYLSALHAALEPDGCVTIPETGETVAKAPGVIFMAADNSNGRGDSTGMYVGIREQNVAFVNRFAKTLLFSYMEPEIESKVIVYRTRCKPALADLIVSFMGVCRAAGETSQLDQVPTLREAFYLAEAIMDGQPARLAFEETIVHRASPESQEVLQQLWKANVQEPQLIAAARGEAVAADPVVDSAPEAPMPIDNF